MSEKDKDQERPLAYPRPTEADQQLNNQAEFVSDDPNEFDREAEDLQRPQKNDEQTKRREEGT